MRIQPWRKTAVSHGSFERPVACGRRIAGGPEDLWRRSLSIAAGMFLLLAVAVPSRGQSPHPGGPYQADPNGGIMFQPQYSTNQPQAIYPAGTPQGYHPWPEISPYQQPNVAYTQHENRDGTWFKKIVNRRREYFSSVELLTTWYRSAGKGRIGSPHAPVAHWGEDGIQPPLGVPIDTIFAFPEVPNLSEDIPGFFPVDRRVFPYPLLDDEEGAELDAIRFSVRSARNLPDPHGEVGLQLRWGFTNEDDTGFMMNAWYGFEGGAAFTRGLEYINGVRVNQAVTAQLGGQNLSAVLGHLPLDNGESIRPDFGTGSTAKFDVLYSIRQTTEAGGTNFSIYQQPIYSADGITIKPLWGMRYLYIHENFGFRGIDSGFDYSVDEETLRPDTGSLTPLYDQYEARLSNDVQSHIAGPEIGLRFDLGKGKKGFKLWGETIFGLAANYEELRMSGENIGDPLADAQILGLDEPRMFQSGVDTRFEERRSTTHVSPVFQQSIFANMALFDTIPGLNRMAMLEGASFRIGYTFLWVGELSRPIDSVKWQGFPRFPELQTNRTSWWMHQLNLAVDWTF